MASESKESGGALLRAAGAEQELAGAKYAPCGVHPNAATVVDAVSPAPDPGRPALQDADVNGAIAALQDAMPDWQCGGADLSSAISKIRSWAEELFARFLPDVWDGRCVTMPPIFLRFQPQDHRVLGHYCPGRNDAGLRWEISINPRHLFCSGEINVAETVLHEIMHLFEDRVGRTPRSRNNYHSSWFRHKAAELGIPCTLYGAAMGILDSSPFMTWAREKGLKGTPMLAWEERVRKSLEDTKAKRVAWACACPKDERVVVLVARVSVLRAICEKCGARFERVRRER